jgi:hypothetical protein
MKQNFSSKKRRELQKKMYRVFRQSIGILSKDMQRILMDDMVTAFENRMKILACVQQPLVQISDTFELVERQINR